MPSIAKARFQAAEWRSRWAAVLLLGLVITATLPGNNAAAQDTEQAGRDRPGTWELISVASNGAKGNGHSGYSCINGVFNGSTLSDDERYVAFSSIASNLDPRDANGASQSDVFVHDRRSGKTTLVSLNSSGILPDTPELPGTCTGLQPNSLFAKGADTPQISANGRFVAFADDRPLTDDDDDSLLRDVFVADLRKGTVELVSVDSNGESPEADHPPRAVAEPTLGISGNGRYVVFMSRSYALDDAMVEEQTDPATDLVNSLGVCLPTQRSGKCAIQLFVHDRLEHTTKMVSTSPDGEPADADITRASISDDGGYVVFESFAGNLDVNDPNPQACTNITGAQRGGKCPDVFLHDLKTGKTEIVSLDSAEQTGSSEKSLVYTSGTVVSDDGRYVAFGGGGELVPGGGGLLKAGLSYLRDRRSGRTENVAVTSAGELLETAGNPMISDDGRFAYFVGRLAAGTMGCEGADPCAGRLRHDRVTGQTDWIWAGTNAGSAGTAIGSSGGVFLETDDGRFHEPLVPQDDAPGATDDVLLRDLGVVNLGAAGLLAPGSADRLVAPDSPGFAGSGIVRLPDRSDDSLVRSPSSEIIGGRVVYRPDLGDVFVRIDLDRLGNLGPLPNSPFGPPLVYGLDLDAQGTHYQLRISGGPVPTFGLFRCEDGPCTEVTRLRGGFGTVGETVVTAIPLTDLGLQDGGQISGVRAFAALGLYSMGPLGILDQATVNLTRSW